MADPEVFLVFVNGTLMRGLELHANLVGATFVEEVRTAPIYRLYSIDDRHPGMFPVPSGGVSVEGELYLVPPAVWHQVEAGEPPHLYRGPVYLEDGRVVSGMLYPPEAVRPHHRDISAYGGWRTYLAARAAERINELP